ncbi:MAG: DUF4097 family beta strand repeat-containing protein [Planctomycetota bacterium]|jgi:hypothetical protein
MRRLISLAAAVTVLLPLTACSFRNGMDFKADTDLSVTAEHVSGSALYVDTKNGRIEVVAEPQRTDVSIEARLRCRGYTQEDADERLAATELSVSRDADQRLVIKPVFPGSRRGGDGASIVVRIPDAHGAHLDTSNGSVVATMLSGVDTSNGSVTVTNLTGALRADTSNGSISLSKVGGPVEADTSNAAIKLSLAGDQSGPLKLDTSNGSITVDVGAAFIGSVSFDTSNGSIHVDDRIGRISSSSLSKNEGRITIGEGGGSSKAAALRAWTPATGASTSRSWGDGLTGSV